MQIKIKTSVDNVSAANYLLNMAISQFANKDLHERLQITPAQVRAAEKHLKASVKALLQAIKS